MQKKFRVKCPHCAKVSFYEEAEISTAFIGIQWGYAVECKECGEDVIFAQSVLDNQDNWVEE